MQLSPESARRGLTQPRSENAIPQRRTDAIVSCCELVMADVMLKKRSLQLLGGVMHANAGMIMALYPENPGPPEPRTKKAKKYHPIK